MFVALEGIDGGGKSTLAPALRQRMRSAARPHVEMFDESAPARLDGPVALKAAKLHDLIWGDPADESQRDLFGTHYHLCLHAAWFSKMRRHRIDPVCRRPGGLVVGDGWYFRTVAKAMVREGWSFERCRSVFEGAGQPDLVVLVDVEPRVAWARRGGRFKPSELGRWDGFDGDPMEAFCSYQAEIRRVLLDFALRLAWIVVAPDASWSRQRVVDEVFVRVTSRLPADPTRADPSALSGL